MLGSSATSIVFVDASEERLPQRVEQSCAKCIALYGIGAMLLRWGGVPWTALGKETSSAI
jgi:hypothetical protein